MTYPRKVNTNIQRKHNDGRYHVRRRCYNHRFVQCLSPRYHICEICGVVIDRETNKLLN